LRKKNVERPGGFIVGGGGWSPGLKTTRGKESEIKNGKNEGGEGCETRAEPPINLEKHDREKKGSVKNLPETRGRSTGVFAAESQHAYS